MFCNKCGAENPNGSVFCSKCGEKLNGIEGKAIEGNNITVDALKELTEETRAKDKKDKAKNRYVHRFFA